jgi:hypothetical protein
MQTGAAASPSSSTTLQSQASTVSFTRVWQTAFFLTSTGRTDFLKF